MYEKRLDMKAILYILCGRAEDHIGDGKNAWTILGYSAKSSEAKAWFDEHYCYSRHYHVTLIQYNLITGISRAVDVFKTQLPVCLYSELTSDKPYPTAIKMGELIRMMASGRKQKAYPRQPAAIHKCLDEEFTAMTAAASALLAAEQAKRDFADELKCFKIQHTTDE